MAMPSFVCCSCLIRLNSRWQKRQVIVPIAVVPAAIAVPVSVPVAVSVFVVVK
jgi:hypothetical protein